MNFYLLSILSSSNSPQPHKFSISIQRRFTSIWRQLAINLVSDEEWLYVSNTSNVIYKVPPELNWMKRPIHFLRCQFLIPSSDDMTRKEHCSKIRWIFGEMSSNCRRKLWLERFFWSNRTVFKFNWHENKPAFLCHEFTRPWGFERFQIEKWSENFPFHWMDLHEMKITNHRYKKTASEREIAVQTTATKFSTRFVIGKQTDELSTHKPRVNYFAWGFDDCSVNRSKSFHFYLARNTEKAEQCAAASKWKNVQAVKTSIELFSLVDKKRIRWMGNMRTFFWIYSNRLFFSSFRMKNV